MSGLGLGARAVALLGVGILSSACVEARAPRPRPPPPRAAAKPVDDAQRSMDLGQKLQSERSFVEAAVAYEQAYRLGRDPRALMAAAQCYRGARRPVSAYEAYDRLLAPEVDLTLPQKQAIARATAELDQVTALLVVNVSEPGADVELDGNAWGKAGALKHRRVRSGTHVVRVVKAGFIPYENEVAFSAGEAKVLDVSLAKSAAPSGTDLPEAERRSAARAAFEDGVDLQEKGKCADAITRFQTAERLYDAPTHLVHLAQCFATTGRLLEAQESYETVARAKLDDKAADAFVQAQATAKSELAAVKARLPRLKIDTTPAGVALEGLVVTVNGTRMPNDLLGVNRPMNPGTYRVEATGAGMHAAADVDLPERATKNLALRLKR